MDTKKPCLLTTFVAGIRYQAFIPLMVFSCKKAYPEYDIMLFLYEDLDSEIKKCLELSGLINSVVIKERFFNPYNKVLSAKKARSYRWVLWDEAFRKYHYVYIVDIDMFYIREPKPLHIQHEERMAITGLPFDNMRRITTIVPNLHLIKERLKIAGVKNIFSFCLSRKISEFRLTGLHFIDVEKYYTTNNIKYIESVKKRIDKRFFFPELYTSSDEALLYLMMKSLGYNMENLGIQSNPYSSLDFNNNLRSEFRPHHGIHIGIFKHSDIEDNLESINNNKVQILNSKTYKYYIEEYKKIINGNDFRKLESVMPAIVKRYLDRTNRYYKITPLQSANKLMNL